MKKRCKTCQTAIRPENVTGYCLTHLLEAKASERFCPCKQCGKTISTKNKSGMCASCLRPPRPIMECTICGSELHKDSVTGRCQAHAAKYYELPEHQWDDYHLLVRGKHMRSEDAVAYLKAGGTVESRGSRAMINEEVASLAKEVAMYFGTTASRILGHSQFMNDVHGRAVVVSVLRRRNRSLSQIGRRIGRDHSSVRNMLMRLPIYAERKPIIPILIERLAA